MTDNREFLTNFVPTGPERWFLSVIREISHTLARQRYVVLTTTVNGERVHGSMKGVLWTGYQPLLDRYRKSATDAGLKVVFTYDTVSFSQDYVFIMNRKQAGKKLYFI